MKIESYLNIFMAFVLCFAFAGCTTWQKFTITGEPNTLIALPDKTPIGTISPTGQLPIKICDQNYYAFLLSKAPDSDVYVPFLLDYKHSSKAAAGTMVVTGFVIPPIGLGYSTYAISRMEQIAYYMQYKYLPSETNSSMTFVKPDIKYVSGKKGRNKGVDRQVGKTDEVKSGKKGQSAQRTNRKIKDNAATVEGEYTASGSITYKDDLIESLDDVTIVLTRTSSNTVEMNIIEADGNYLYKNSIVYTVKAKRKGQYELTTELFGFKINIDANGAISYSSLVGGVDGTTYTIELKGKRIE